MLKIMFLNVRNVRTKISKVRNRYHTWNSSGQVISTDMIGSKICQQPNSNVCLMAPCAAWKNAHSDESTMWCAPSNSLNLTPDNLCPLRQPLSHIDRNPFSIPGTNDFGTFVPTVSSENSNKVFLFGGSGCRIDLKFWD